MKKALSLTLFGALVAGVALAAPPTVPELLPHVPTQAQVIVAVDAATLRGHPAVQGWLLAHASWGSADSEAARFLAEAGLDPLRDVTAMVVAVTLSGSDGGTVAFFAGRFDATALAAALTKRGASPVTFGAVSGFRLPEKNSASAAAVFAQPSPELIVVGGETQVAEALSAKSTGNSLVDSAVTAGQIDPRAPFWAVARIPSDAHQRACDAAAGIQGGVEEPVRQVVMASGAVQTVAFQAFLDDSLTISAVAVADTAENAELLRDATKGALAAARLRSQERAPDLVSVLRDVQVQASGTQVTLASVIPIALVEKLLASHQITRQGDAPGHS